jgi:AraC-like DNA-binding protein
MGSFRPGTDRRHLTANALSPSPSLRQCPHDYSIRAGQNLPDKEFRYLRTVIVTAAVHWGFSSDRKAFALTFQHWAGVSPYTSTFVLAETCVFDKQFRGLFCCGPLIVKYEGYRVQKNIIFAYVKYTNHFALSQ